MMFEVGSKVYLKDEIREGGVYEGYRFFKGMVFSECLTITHINLGTSDYDGSARLTNGFYYPLSVLELSDNRKKYEISTEEELIDMIC